MNKVKILTSLSQEELEYHQGLLQEHNIESNIISSELQNNIHLYQNNFKEYYLVISEENLHEANNILKINNLEEKEIESPIEPNYIRKAFYATAVGLGIPFAGCILSFYYLSFCINIPEHRTKVILIAIFNIFFMLIQAVYLYLKIFNIRL